MKTFNFDGTAFRYESRFCRVYTITLVCLLILLATPAAFGVAAFQVGLRESFASLIELLQNVRDDFTGSWSNDHDWNLV